MGIQGTPSIKSAAGILSGVLLVLIATYALSQFDVTRQITGLQKGSLPTGS